jgi:hypothetical protein
MSYWGYWGIREVTAGHGSLSAVTGVPRYSLPVRATNPNLEMHDVPLGLSACSWRRFAASIGARLGRTSIFVCLGLSLLISPAARLDAQTSEGAPDAPAAPVQGCYRISLGPWTPTMSLGGDAGLIVLPELIELTGISQSASESATTPRYLMRSPGNARAYDYTHWSQVHSADSLDLTWSNGLSGVHVRGHFNGQAIAGYAYTFWDFARPQQSARFFAQQVECSPGA